MRRAAMSSDPLSGHECGDSRYLAIAFFDACFEAAPRRSRIEGCGQRRDSRRSWMPDEDFAKVWAKLQQNWASGRYDASAAPVDVRLSSMNELTLES